MNTQKLVASILFFGAVITPFGVGAQSGDIAAQIQALLNQVAQLQAQIKLQETQSTNVRGWCHEFRRNLGVGDTSPEVFSLAITLSRENLGTSLTEGQTAFDERVRLAVVAFQKKYGIPQTGFVGPLTRSKLNSLYRCS